MPPTQITAHSTCTREHPSPDVHPVSSCSSASSARSSAAAVERGAASVTPRPAAKACAKPARLPSAERSSGSLRAARSAAIASRSFDVGGGAVEHQVRGAALVGCELQCALGRPDVGHAGLDRHQHEVGGTHRDAGVGVELRRAVDQHHVVARASGARVRPAGASRRCRRTARAAAWLQPRTAERVPAAEALLRVDVEQRDAVRSGAKAAAMLAASVVLPVPPFCCATVMTTAMAATPLVRCSIAHRGGLI